MKINRNYNSRGLVKSFPKALSQSLFGEETEYCFETPGFKSGLMCSVISKSYNLQLTPSPLQIISEDISELQKNQTTTMAKIAQYKRKLMALSHRTLQVTRIVSITRSDAWSSAGRQTERGQDGLCSLVRAWLVLQMEF